MQAIRAVEMYQYIYQYIYSMHILTTVPAPVLPSNVKKFAMGASRAPSVLSISWASIPPTIAHTGESSCEAVTAKLLRKGLSMQKKKVT